MNYSNTTTYKTFISRSGNGTGGFANSTVNLWRSTAAITTVYLFAAGGSLDAGTTATLYGIKNA